MAEKSAKYRQEIQQVRRFLNHTCLGLPLHAIHKPSVSVICIRFLVHFLSRHLAYGFLLIRSSSSSMNTIMSIPKILPADVVEQMMFVSGETGDPSIETTGIIEEIVRQQVVEIVIIPIPSNASLIVS